MRIKHYEVVRLLGRGASGGVVLARDTRLERLVALKVPLRRRRAAERLLAEARMLARLTHENIVTVHDVSATSGIPFLTLEYIEGRTLRELCTPRGIPVRIAVDTMVQVAHALAHAHELGVVHRDLTPKNIMVADAGPTKLLDFGLAVQIGGVLLERGAPRPAYRRGVAAGTLLYMSPEQARAEDVDYRSDVWAFGIILHELITGRHPLAPYVQGKLRSLVDPDIPLPTAELDHTAPPALAHVIRRCLSKRPDERFDTAREIAVALDRIAGDLHVRGERTIRRVLAEEPRFCRGAGAEHGRSARDSSSRDDVEQTRGPT